MTADDRGDGSARTAEQLRTALHQGLEDVTPSPALAGILRRSQETTRSRVPRRAWVPVLGGALAAAALVATVVTVGGRGGPDHGNEPAVTTAPLRPLTVYVVDATGTRYGPAGHLFPEQVRAADTGNLGLDAVNALLSTVPDDPDYLNEWATVHGTQGGDLALKTPVTVDSVREGDGVITVDFSGPLDNPFPAAAFDWTFDPAAFAQQVVWTVQAALHSDAPVEMTMNGSPVHTVLFADVTQPVGKDPAALAPIQIQAPVQGATVSSPVSVSGQGRGFEGTINWRVLHDGKVVKQGNTTGGAFEQLAPFSFDVPLPSGDYTVECFEYSADNGNVINLDSKDFTVR
ncbi:MAG: Gmad2 immunoglobulin-like domain-containing protein [Nocardioidaceae bacterium]